MLFRSAYGKRRYVTLGGKGEGWTRARADAELQNVLADVRRGLWEPPKSEAVVALAREIPTFHMFASEWFARQTAEGGRHGGGLSAKGVVDLEWRIAKHLLPYFAAMRLDAITVEDVDRYRAAKVRAGNLGATSINKTLQRSRRSLRLPANTATSIATWRRAGAAGCPPQPRRVRRSIAPTTSRRCWMPRPNWTPMHLFATAKDGRSFRRCCSKA